MQDASAATITAQASAAQPVAERMAPHSPHRDTMKRARAIRRDAQAHASCYRAQACTRIMRTRHTRYAHRRTGERALIRVEGGPRRSTQFSSRGYSPTACLMPQLFSLSSSEVSLALIRPISSTRRGLIFAAMHLPTLISKALTEPPIASDSNRHNDEHEQSELPGT